MMAPTQPLTAVGRKYRTNQIIIRISRSHAKKDGFIRRIEPALLLALQGMRGIGAAKGRLQKGSESLLLPPSRCNSATAQVNNLTSIQHQAILLQDYSLILQTNCYFDFVG